MVKKFINIIKDITYITYIPVVLIALHYRILYKKRKKTKKTSEKNLYYYNAAAQWVINKQEGKSMVKYLNSKGIKKIAIYGMGSMEELLYNELKNTEIEIEYFIDGNASNYEFMFDVIGINEIEKQKNVDAIIVTPIFDFLEIADKLKKVINCEIISLEEIIYSLEQ